MYEVWLALNIVWEIALGVWPLVLVAAVLWAMLMVAALRRPGTRWRARLPLALAAAAGAAVLAFLLVPGWSRSSITELGYWVDWVILLAIAGVAGVVALLFAWPLLSLRRGNVQA